MGVQVRFSATIALCLAALSAAPALAQDSPQAPAEDGVRMTAAQLFDYADAARDTFVRAYVLAIRMLLIVSIPIAVATVFLAEAIILFFGGREYLPHSVIALQVLIWFLPFSYVNSLTQYVLIAINQQRFITTSFIIATGLNIILNLILIPMYSYVGAAAVTIVSEVVLLVPFLYCLRRHLGRHRQSQHHVRKRYAQNFSPRSHGSYLRIRI